MEMIDLKNLDNKSKIQLGVTSLLILVFVFIMGKSIKTIISKTRKPKGNSSYITPGAFKEIMKRDMQAAGAEKPDSSQAYENVIKEEEGISWGRDPFSKRSALEGGPVSVSGLKLEGILWHHDAEPNAIINGEVLSAGDNIGGLKVVEIQKDAVIVNDGEKNYKLTLW